MDSTVEHCGLIVPLWNWNAGALRRVVWWWCGFNRTFMELKRLYSGIVCERCAGFNRTFMELKHEDEWQDPLPAPGLIVPLWNWNFIADDIYTREYFGLIVPLWNWNWSCLRFLCVSSQGLIVPLWNWNITLYTADKGADDGLIVPLWNWNVDDRLNTGKSLEWFNRTFMELKHAGARLDERLSIRFNRTFMELKHKMQAIINNHFAV